jgi:ATP adenylyltransferase
MEYIEAADHAGGCFLCAYPKENRDAERFILSRSNSAFIILNAFPYANGHLMVAPYRHTADMASLSPEEVLDMWGLVNRSLDVLMKAYKPQGFNIGVNLGRVAGAGLEEHVHVHIVPRWNGDTNFMPVLADVRVIPASLQATYERLRGCLDGD